MRSMCIGGPRFSPGQARPPRNVSQAGEQPNQKALEVVEVRPPNCFGQGFGAGGADRNFGAVNPLARGGSQPGGWTLARYLQCFHCPPAGAWTFQAIAVVDGW